jgi:hypothetical protein
MLVHRLKTIVRCQRGVALPMALLSLLILSALMVAFAMLSASEPVLANNQLQVAQARAIAESGVERAIWALNQGLNNPGDPNAIPIPFVTPAAPYDGSTAIPVLVNGAQVGVFTVAVTNGANSYERNIVATGWAPTNAGTGPKAKQRIQVTVSQMRFLNPPAALTVRGEIDASGNVLIDSRSDTSCGAKLGTYSQGATSVASAATIYGADGNDVANQSGGDMTQNAAHWTFSQYAYSNNELSVLKALARANSTYYQGPMSFNSSNQMPNGIIYVDTVTGNNIDVNGPNTTPISDFASVEIQTNAPSDASGIFSGVLVVAGSLSISGNFQMHGFIYVQNHFTYVGAGTAEIVGAVLSQNVRDTSATSIDTGSASIIWNCSYAKTGGGQLPQTFTIQSGTYKEISG